MFILMVLILLAPQYQRTQQFNCTILEGGDRIHAKCDGPPGASEGYKPELWLTREEWYEEWRYRLRRDGTCRKQNLPKVGQRFRAVWEYMPGEEGATLVPLAHCRVRSRR